MRAWTGTSSLAGLLTWHGPASATSSSPSSAASQARSQPCSSSLHQKCMHQEHVWVRGRLICSEFSGCSSRAEVPQQDVAMGLGG